MTFRWPLLVWALALSGACGDSKPAESPAGDATDEAGAKSIEKVTEEGPVRATVSLSPATPRFGDRLTLTLTVESAAGVRVDMPPFGEALSRGVGSLGRFEILEHKPRARPRPEGGMIQSETYVLKPPGSGRHRIPPLRIVFVDDRPGQSASQNRDAGPGGAAEPRELLTEEIPLQVESVLDDGEVVGQLEPAMDTLPLRPGPSWLARFWPLLIGGPLIVAAVFGTVVWRRAARRRARVSAYDVAMRQLARLQAGGFPDAEGADQWYVDLSGIVRRYIEARFGVRAPELTTEEFLREASRSPDLGPGPGKGHHDRLASFLARCDRVKFAQYHPDESESRDALAAAQEFVELTRLRRADAAEEAEA